MCQRELRGRAGQQSSTTVFRLHYAVFRTQFTECVVLVTLKMEEHIIEAVRPHLEQRVQSLLTSQDYKKLLLTMCAHIVSRNVSRAASPCPASQYALTLCHAVFLVLRLPALLCPALRPPASQCAPGLTHVQTETEPSNIQYLFYDD